MTHHLDSDSSVGVIRCDENLDASSVVNVKNRISRLANQNCKHFLIDFGRTRQIDLTGLGILLDRIQKLRAVKGDARLFNIAPTVFETFKSVGADGVIETFPTEDEARRSF